MVSQGKVKFNPSFSGAIYVYLCIYVFFPRLFLNLSDTRGDVLLSQVLARNKVSSDSNGKKKTNTNMGSPEKKILDILDLL